MQYDDWAQEYDRRWRHYTAVSPDALLDALDLRGVRDVVDVRCGTGVKMCVGLGSLGLPLGPRNSSSRDEREHVMKFVNVRLLTGDFSAAVTFWRDIMGLEMTYGDETMGYAYFDTGNSGVELLDRDAFATTLGEATPTPTPEGHQAVLVFGVDDVDATYRDLVARGATPLAEPQDRPAWRARTAPLRAYDGYLVQVYSPPRDANAPNT